MGAIRHFALHLHLLSGQRARALAMLQVLADGRAAPCTQGPAAAWAQAHDATRAAALLGERALFETLLARLEALPCTERQQPRLAVLRGHRARRAGDAAGAIAHWRQALQGEAALQRLGQGLEVRLFLAAALAEAGHRAEAAALLPAVLQALAEGAGRGALGLAREALAVLQSCGLALDLAGPGAAPGPDPGPEPLRPGGLSEREQEVLERIAAGDSNKLIARAFELSPHTVKRHVANILDKLGVDSRGQAAAWYRRHAGS
jgi:LuxR family maltose regulon positive regulatory protein